MSKAIQMVEFNEDDNPFLDFPFKTRYALKQNVFSVQHANIYKLLRNRGLSFTTNALNGNGTMQAKQIKQ